MHAKLSLALTPDSGLTGFSKTSHESLLHPISKSAIAQLRAYAWKSMPFITDSNTEKGVRVRIRVERSQNRTMLRHVLICSFLSGIHRCRFDPGLPELIEKGYSFGDTFPSLQEFWSTIFKDSKRAQLK
ncbi:hypothetical protein CEXT_72301 [Caerostris extrusa]|uniref:Uncharacterized protein n=1 Tax=Caerostris extrusa TaxID=172846 RepID=A0AAV4M615_CAEEX|nr:hypothetical protein CEXT_72301 [Caerostris extrusa]